MVPNHWELAKRLTVAPEIPVVVVTADTFRTLPAPKTPLVPCGRVSLSPEPQSSQNHLQLMDCSQLILNSEVCKWASSDKPSAHRNAACQLFSWAQKCSFKRLWHKPSCSIIAQYSLSPKSGGSKRHQGASGSSFLGDCWMTCQRYVSELSWFQDVNPLLYN